MSRGRDYIRPIEFELIELFKHNSIYGTATEVAKILLDQGHHHVYSSVMDNLLILTKVGFLICEKGQFSRSPDASKANLTQKIHLDLPSSPKHPTHCDKCGRGFRPGDEFVIHSFANVQLCLCVDCHEQKAVA